MKKLVLLFSLIFIASIFTGSVYSQGCVEATSDDGPQVVGYIQPEFNSYFFGDDSKGNAIKPSTFAFRRARIGIVGSIPYDISYYVMAELSPTVGGPMLLDAFVTYSPFGKYFKVSMGQFKTPFSLEVNTACYALNTIRRSTVVDQMASPFRELGIMVLGAIGKERDIFTYKLMLLNGTGINHLDDNSNKEFAGRLTVAPIEGITIGASMRTGLVGTVSSSGDQKKRTRYAADITLKKWNALLQAEYIFGTDVGDLGSSGGGCGKSTLELTEYKKNGLWVTAMYKFGFGLEPVVKYEVYNPDGTNYKYLGVTQNYGQATWTFGVNYFLNEWTRIQINYLYNAEETVGTVINEYSNDALLIQVQVKF